MLKRVCGAKAFIVMLKRRLAAGLGHRVVEGDVFFHRFDSLCKGLLKALAAQADLVHLISGARERCTGGGFAFLKHRNSRKARTSAMFSSVLSEMGLA